MNWWGISTLRLFGLAKDIKLVSREQLQLNRETQQFERAAA
jgi:hypothetical protein